MKRIILMRHGLAEDTRGDIIDADRSLTAEGAESAVAVAEKLRSFQPVDAIFSSPYSRSRETAAIMAEALTESVVFIWEELVPETQASRVFDRIRALKNEWHTILIVGHNPVLEDLAALLIGQTEKRFHLSKCGVLTFESSAEKWDSWKGSQPSLSWSLSSENKILRVASPFCIASVRYGIILTQRFEKLLEQAAAGERETLRDLRITARRLTAFCRFFPSDAVKEAKLKRQFNRLLRATRALRDVQIQQQLLSGLCEDPNLFETLEKEEIRLLAEWDKTYEVLKAFPWPDAFRALLSALDQHLLQPSDGEFSDSCHRRLTAKIYSHVRKAYRELKEQPAPKLDAWHTLRIRLRKARYGLEWSLFAQDRPETKKATEELVTALGHLGALHDWSVLAKRMGLLKKQDSATLGSCAALIKKQIEEERLWCETMVPPLLKRLKKGARLG